MSWSSQMMEGGQDSYSPWRKAQCQSLTGGRTHTPDHQESPGLVLLFGPLPQGSDLPPQTEACHEPSYPGEYMRVLQKPFNSLDLSAIFYTCHSLRFTYPEITGRVTLCPEQYLMNVLPEPSPKKNSLRKESLNLAMRSVMGCSLACSFAPCLWPVLGSCDQQHKINFSPSRKLRKGATFTSSTWKCPQCRTNASAPIRQESTPSFLLLDVQIFGNSWIVRKNTSSTFYLICSF